jgi:putative endonuclease
MPYYLYILQSQFNRKFYVGSSEDPHCRLLYHNSIEKGFTARYRPWKLVFVKEFPSKSLAQKAERKIKSWKSRLMIERLIKREITL